MRTPLVVVAGQGGTDAIAGALLRQPGTVVVEHRFDGHGVTRTIIALRDGVLSTRDTALGLLGHCVSCTVRDDLLVLLRRMSRMPDVSRIVVHLAGWLEPEPMCQAIDEVSVSPGAGFDDGPAALDVEVTAVVVAVDAENWLTRALGEDELDDGRTLAQIVVCQVEFADVVVIDRPEPTLMAVLRRLAARARLTAGVDQLELALANLEPEARRGRSDHPHGPLLAGQPPLEESHGVHLFEFHARRPFHPERLHDAIDWLLDGVIRTRGRLWVASRPQYALWLESAGAGLRIGPAGKWLAAMSAAEAACVTPERRAFADLLWERSFGDRHTSMTILACGADPPDVNAALRAALLTDDELASPADWPYFPDPFGELHEEPCGDSVEVATRLEEDHGS